MTLHIPTCRLINNFFFVFHSIYTSQWTTPYYSNLLYDKHFVEESYEPLKGIQRRAVCTWAKVLEERITSIFRVENQPRKKPEGKICLGPCCTLVCCMADFPPWRWRWYVPPKHQFTNGLHGAISQKMATFLTREARASDSTHTHLPSATCNTDYTELNQPKLSWHIQ
jgi:hypothetical protein